MAIMLACGGGGSSDTGESDFPEIISMDPTSDATGIGLNAQISATFSRDMNPDTITADTFILEDGPVSTVEGTVMYENRVATFIPADPLAYLIEYTVTITPGASDVDGNHLEANYSWKFTTGIDPCSPNPCYEGVECTAIPPDGLCHSCASCPPGMIGDGVTCRYPVSCADLLENLPETSSGEATIDPDGEGGSAPFRVWCDMSTDGGGWTLCASLTKGYVPAETLYNANGYAFQARKNGDDNYVFEREAPARTTATWNNSESLNYGTFCRKMTAVSTETWIVAKMYNYANNYGASAKNSDYSLVRQGIYQGNLFIQWFTNSSDPRTFTRKSGDTLYVQSNSNGYGGAYVTPNVGWSPDNMSQPYTQGTNPWGSVDDTVLCSGCTSSGAGYNSLPYGETTILNNMSHSFWEGISNPRYGWSDCTANGNCSYHESGMGIWLFFVR